MQDHYEEATMYSLSTSPPPGPERRESERLLTLYRVGSITLNERRELCLIRNISAGGIKMRVYCRVSVGQSLAVELKSGQAIEGKVTWVDEYNIGVTFNELIDVVELLSASFNGPRPRMPRIEVRAYVTIREGASVYRILACDVSQGGLKIETQTLLPVGADVVITLAGLGSQAGVVRWVENGFCGITFNRLLPLPELVNWLQEQNREIGIPSDAVRMERALRRPGRSALATKSND